VRRLFFGKVGHGLKGEKGFQAIGRAQLGQVDSPEPSSLPFPDLRRLPDSSRLWSDRSVELPNPS
jgi:hypothetical protein